MKIVSIVLTVLLTTIMIYFETLIPPAPKQYVTGYDIPEGLDPDKPIVVNGIKFNPKFVYSKNEEVRKRIRHQMEQAQKPLTPRTCHTNSRFRPFTPLSKSEIMYIAKAKVIQELLIGKKIGFVLDKKGEIIYENFEILGFNINGPQILTSAGQTYRLEFWRLNDESKIKVGYDKKLRELLQKEKNNEDFGEYGKGRRF